MQFLLACMRAKIWSTPFLQQGKEVERQPSSEEVAAEIVKNNPWGQGHYSFLVRYARAWP